MKKIRLGDLLVAEGIIGNEQLYYALEVQKKTGKRLGDVLQELNYVDAIKISKVLEKHLGISYINLDKQYIEPMILKLVPEEFARKNTVMPVCVQNNKLVVAMDDPLDMLLINDLEITTGFSVEARVGLKSEILETIDKYYLKQSAEEAVSDFTKEIKVDLGKKEIEASLFNEINKAPVVRLVNTIISQAAQRKASDIHIEPEETNLRIRFRIDGDLHEIMKPTKQTHGAIVTRIKIMANMDIAERRVPQDGRIEAEVGEKKYDLRVSTLPAIYGEKVVIRMVDRTSFLFDKKTLGLTDKGLGYFNDIVKSNHGIILITGPTGSGKSTTLYAMLNEVNKTHKNILTIEDPVEYRMKGLNQSQVNEKAGYTFASGLRSMLRQDPDVIMVGEIRDFETASIASRAAITGHLVLSTLHTNSAVSTINRLLDMGIKPYIISSTIVAIVSQTLIKKNCPYCSVPYMPDDDELDILGIKNDGMMIDIFKGIGCKKCNRTGYLGRTAVFEIIKFDTMAREIINSGQSLENLRQYFRKKGMDSLVDNCKAMVLSGVTSMDELARISYSIEG